MTRRLVSLYRRIAVASVAAASIVTLSACSRPANVTQGNTPQPPTGESSQPPAGESSTSTLAKELPAQYRSWARQATPLTACGFDPIRKGADGSLAVSGWGIIEAAAGVVPSGFVLQVEKNGSNFYVTPQPADRQDLVKKFNNPALARSGFTLNLAAQQVTPPFTATMIIAFDDRLFTCEYKLQA